ncbi:hypothetical protein ABZX40_34855 [Streptomyces sp. NPDC004610]|uniref:hypothetical protein n=1 Tax=unclassified Streptomyces TaxID=2593676 RepID=UPI0033B31D74
MHGPGSPSAPAAPSSALLAVLALLVVVLGARLTARAFAATVTLRSLVLGVLALWFD